MKKIIFAIFVLFALDQLSKFAVQTFMELHQTIHIMPSFALHYTQNTGVAFSMFAGTNLYVLILVNLAILALLLFLWWRASPTQKLIHIGFTLIFAGAIGNIISRFMFGYVVDFFLFYIQNWQFAVFNIADTYITCGAILLVANELLPLVKKNDNINKGAKL